MTEKNAELDCNVDEPRTASKTDGVRVVSGVLRGQKPVKRGQMFPV
uniref:Uncharacterized protein n=1 Tax=Anguilla anguilla TaxID=7936 RepID=A0A0E9QDR0_ANGAN